MHTPLLCCPPSSDPIWAPPFSSKKSIQNKASLLRNGSQKAGLRLQRSAAAPAPCHTLPPPPSSVLKDVDETRDHFVAPATATTCIFCILDRLVNSASHGPVIQSLRTVGHAVLLATRREHDSLAPKKRV
ncbi:hypothetical protein CORC01_10719 [Colletotrichum orchidophilum]|uniref:Uncharacterized protein n=1 Tax=Colletotrichum orchidophilum TaxID=1209926 RepID=A0A1G4AY16_9PEZI|nr:uncharacterized protein CORC01_10719 [Colletotrichum orchidophilum]OHE94027.1 hypothetical protein CORC01_10719 [Colletotrichum orchidophilum]